MATVGHPFLDKVFVGAPVEIGTFSQPFAGVLLEGETIEMEFQGIRDGMMFTDRRMIVINKQGMRGKKIEVSSFSWKAMTAFSVENSGTFDLDAELKFCGSGWGVCEVVLTKGTKVAEIARYIGAKIL